MPLTTHDWERNVGGVAPTYGARQMRQAFVGSGFSGFRPTLPGPDALPPAQVGPVRPTPPDPRPSRNSRQTSPSPACGRRWRAAPGEGASAASPHQRLARGTNARFAALAPLIRPAGTFSRTREKGWSPARRQSWPCLVHNANTSSRPRKNPVASCPASRDNAPSGIPPASHAFLVPHPRHDTSPSPQHFAARQPRRPAYRQKTRNRTAARSIRVLSSLQCA